MTWENLKNLIYKKYSKNAGKMILHAGVITWAAACVSQVAAVVYNDKIPPEQKKFLVPQEIADGLLNIAAFYIVTKSMKEIAGKFVSTGKWSNQAIRDFVKKVAPNTKLGHFDTNLTETFKGQDEFHNAYDPFKSGIEMVATSIASVVSCNVATPYIRNYIGAVQQKRSLAAENKNNFKTINVTKSPNPLKV